MTFQLSVFMNLLKRRSSLSLISLLWFAIEMGLIEAGIGRDSRMKLICLEKLAWQSGPVKDLL